MLGTLSTADLYPSPEVPRHLGAARLRGPGVYLIAYDFFARRRRSLAPPR